MSEWQLAIIRDPHGIFQYDPDGELFPLIGEKVRVRRYTTTYAFVWRKEHGIPCDCPAEDYATIHPEDLARFGIFTDWTVALCCHEILTD